MTTTVPLQIIDLHDDGFHPLVNVSVFGRIYKMVLDTGASKTAFDHGNLLKEFIDINSSDRLSTGLGTKSMVSHTAIINDMHIGELKIEAFEVAVLDLSGINIAYRQLNQPEVLGVLGGDILVKYKALIDYEHALISLKSCL